MKRVYTIIITITIKLACIDFMSPGYLALTRATENWRHSRAVKMKLMPSKCNWELAGTCIAWEGILKIRHLGNEMIIIGLFSSSSWVLVLLEAGSILVMWSPMKASFDWILSLYPPTWTEVSFLLPFLMMYFIPYWCGTSSAVSYSSCLYTYFTKVNYCRQFVSFSFTLMLLVIVFSSKEKRKTHWKGK